MRGSPQGETQAANLEKGSGFRLLAETRIHLPEPSSEFKTSLKYKSLNSDSASLAAASPPEEKEEGEDDHQDHKDRQKNSQDGADKGQ